MPRYFFHVHDGKDLVDREGLELPDIDAAKAAAARYAGDLLRFHPAEFWNGDEWMMHVENENGLLLFSLLLVTKDAPALLKPQPPLNM